MLPSNQVTISQASGGNYSHLSFSGNLSGISTQLVVQNITFLSYSSNPAVLWNDTTGGGAGIHIDRCRFYTGGSAITFQAGDGAFKISNCHCVGQYVSIWAYVAIEAYFNTCVSTGFGILLFGASTASNNLCVQNQTAGVFAIASATGYNNSTGDATAGDGNWSTGANNRINETDANIKPMLDNANDFFPLDWRIHTSSALVGQGVAVGGITLDIDGQTRANPPSIGCSEGISFGAAASGGNSKFYGKVQ
jgi:hypothetical protein